MSLQPCPNLISAGACNVPNCSFDHAVLVCIPCGFYSTFRNFYDNHLRTKTHWRATSDTTSAAYVAALLESENDRNGIHVFGRLDFGVVDESVARDGRERHVLDVELQVGATPVKLETVLLSSRGRINAPNAQTAFQAVVLGERERLDPSTPTKIMVILRTSGVGQFEDRLILTFTRISDGLQWVITRPVIATIGNSAAHAAFPPTAPYIPPTSRAYAPVHEVIPGVEAPALKAIPYVRRLPLAKVPQSFQVLMTRSEDGGPSLPLIRARIPARLTMGTYPHFFKGLLWIEELKLLEDMERYDIHNAALTKQKNTYRLDVPGLAEKRPSVLVGDTILVRQDSDPQGRWFEGGVHLVQVNQIGVQFGRSFKWAAGQHYHVRFKVNRNPLRRMHAALQAPVSRQDLLFPDVADVAKLPNPVPTQATTHLVIHNPLVANNPQQLQAVVSIAMRPPGKLPFAIFGPPGTGKTTTMIEAIRQVLKNGNSVVLACAPSNSAADNIAEGLSDLGAEILFRLYAPSRPRHEVPATLLPFATLNSADHFTVHPIQRMKNFRIIVSTCVSAAILSGIGIDAGHFTHIFIDEAGQATEPEAVVSVRTLAGQRTNVILSGDPQQLGPIIRSGIANQLKLGVSFLERLMSSPIYNPRTYRDQTVVKLVRNYRSHNAIIQIPNERFYDGDLVASGDAVKINAYIDSTYLQETANPKFPIVFHAVAGQDDRESTSPSYFNKFEAIKVRDTVQALLGAHRLPGLTSADIGVISPYRAQCQKIRALLRALGGGAENVKVASVEEYQGKEHRVIIISTVRSSRDLIQYDVRHTLGFVANPRRFNVAVTRAQALLIVVGDPEVLSLDPLWRQFLNYVHNHQGWVGNPIGWDPTAEVNENGGYDREARVAAQLDMDDFARQVGEMAEDDQVDTGEDPPLIEDD
ncbi:P-loop containing nucleoside triphosphate hydrolase protein [Pluteus cervinus]|uniref:P-loop containing nucleoside triphosphate hydrolase protein n=1 Tax=Pluteus cervinus TaxID=181527 RepID=A0ACD3B411_9AGAR|nr:P-loop containing nucleoside triphosphate hydrolase protein [Pluteus cervinus]